MMSALLSRFAKLVMVICMGLGDLDMIDEAATFERFGYTSDKWGPHSAKKIVVVCEGCGEKRVVEKAHSEGLCKPCSKLGNKNPNFGRVMSDEEKRGFCGGGRECTSDTKRKISIENGGKRNGNWKGGITPVVTAIRKSPAYKNWRMAVFERDNYTCQMCGDVTGGNLQAHHIKPRREHKNDLLVFDIDNGVTLCKDCHISIRRKEHDFIGYFETIVETRRNDL
jgi:5-methylcytosine-specific restriction endonuclease McrA